MFARCSYLLAPWKRCGGAALLALLALARPVTAQITHAVAMQVGSGVTIEATSIYGDVPDRGFAPLRITIANVSPTDGIWTLNTISNWYGSSGQGYTTEVKCAVPAHTTRVFEVLAPLYPAGGDRQLPLSVNGPGVDSPNVYWTSTFARPTSGAGRKRGRIDGAEVFVGLSPTLARAHGNDIKDYILNMQHRPYALGGLDPNLLSSDWRAYTGFDFLVYTATDWVAVPPGARAAILQWVASGGELRLVADQDGGLGLAARQGEHYGAGQLLLFPEEDLKNYDYKTEHIKPDERFIFNVSYKAALSPLVPAPPSAAPAPPSAVPVAATPVVKNYSAEAPRIKDEFTLVAWVIVAFGIVVGPVNLFWICGGSRRSRLLWVTPLLSLVTTLVLLVFIFASEGVGGPGIFYRVTLLLPESKMAYVTEVESAATGVLFDREFDLAEPAWLLTSQNDRSNQPPRGEFAAIGTHYRGDWIGSRRESVLLGRAMVPSRAAVTLAPAPADAKGSADAPSLRSEYNGWLENLYYLDDAGRPWKIGRLSHGQIARLEPATLAELSAAWIENVNSAPGWLHEHLRRLTPQPGAFFAMGDGAGAGLEPTVSGLRWTCFRDVITGPVSP